MQKNLPQKFKHKKICLKDIKKNTISSLNDIEHFLNTVNHTLKCIKVYNIIKKPNKN